MILIIVMFCAILSFSENSVGRINATFYDFNSFFEMDASHLVNRYYIRAQIINSKYVKDFIFNLGGPVSEDCNQTSIACIKYKHEKIYTSVTSARSWSISDAGLNISFPTKETVIFTLPKSGKKVNISGKNDYLQLVMSFNCGEEKNITLEEMDPFTYLLKISSPNACQRIFDIYSKTISESKNIIGLGLILLSIFLAIPYPKESDQAKLKSSFTIMISLIMGMLVQLLYYIQISNETYLNSLWKHSIFTSIFQILVFLAIWNSFVFIGYSLYLNMRSKNATYVVLLINWIYVSLVIPILLIILYNFFYICDILLGSFVLNFMSIIIMLSSAFLVYWICSNSYDKLIQHSFTLTVTFILYLLLLYNVSSRIPSWIAFLIIFALITIIFNVIGLSKHTEFLRIFVGSFLIYSGFILFGEFPNFLEMNLMKKSGINISAEAIYLLVIIPLLHSTFIYNGFHCCETSTNGLLLGLRNLIISLGQKNFFQKLVPMEILGSITKYIKPLFENLPHGKAS